MSGRISGGGQEWAFQFCRHSQVDTRDGQQSPDRLILQGVLGDVTVEHGKVSALSATALRGEVLPERVPAEGLRILRDGEPGDPEVTLSPLAYQYQHRAEIEAVMQGTDRDTAFDTLCASVGAALAEACRQRGLERTSFYGWKRRFRTQGFEGFRSLVLS